MKSADPVEHRKQLDVFTILDDTAMTTLDRSTLELWANCPFAAKEHELHRPVMPEIAEVGQLAHAAFSQAIQEWIGTEGQITTNDLRMALESAARSSRPDLQPQVIEAIWASSWAWSKLVWGIHPMNILRFDGGDYLDRSGQLSIAFNDLNVIVTSELDLLYAGPSPELLHEADYKTGHKMFTAATVRDSFQFQLHALLVFHNYPEVNGLEVTIWNTRRNDRTYKVVFKRDDLPDFVARVRMAVQVRLQQFETPETWPTAEKCGICDVASRCPVANNPMRVLEDNPAAFVLDMVAVQARLDAMTELATKFVDANKCEIVAGDVCFGRGKPKTERKQSAALYEVSLTKGE